MTNVNWLLIEIGFVVNPVKKIIRYPWTFMIDPPRIYRCVTLLTFLYHISKLWCLTTYMLFIYFLQFILIKSKKVLILY